MSEGCHAAYLVLMALRGDRRSVMAVVFTGVQCHQEGEEVMSPNSATGDLLLGKVRGASLERSERHTGLQRDRRNI